MVITLYDVNYLFGSPVKFLVVSKWGEEQVFLICSSIKNSFYSVGETQREGEKRQANKLLMCILFSFKAYKCVYWLLI